MSITNEFALALAQDLVLEEEPIGLDSDETTYQAAYRVLWELSQEERYEVNELAATMEAEMASERVESIKVGNVTFEAVGLEPLLDDRRAFGPEGRDYGTEKVVPEVLDAVECSARWLHNINVLTASLKRGKEAKQKLLAKEEVRVAGMAFQEKALWAMKAGKSKELGNYKLSQACWAKWRGTVIPAAWNQVSECEEKLASLRARITQAWDGYWVAQERLEDLVDQHGGWYESLYKGLKGYNPMRYPTVTGDVNQQKDWNVPVLSAFEAPAVEGWKFLFPPRLQRQGRGAMDLDISEMSVGEWAVGSKPKLTEQERVARKAMIDAHLAA